jgi:hypothetical protein
MTKKSGSAIFIPQPANEMQHYKFQISKSKYQMEDADLCAPPRWAINFDL